MAPPEVIQAVDLTLDTVGRYDRPDLHARLRRSRERLLDEHVRVLVVGEFKQGKSYLINGLVNAPVCPVDDDVATSVPTAVRYAENPTVTLTRELDRDEAPGGGAADGGATGEGGGAAGCTSTGPAEQRTERTDIPLEKLAEYVSEAGNPGNRRRLSQAEVGIPRKLLAGGLELVDTPGVGGLGSVHGAMTMAALPSADAVLLVSDAAQEYTATELEFLRQATKVCPNVCCVLTKIDLYPEWRRIADLDRAHLATAGVDADLFPVSSRLRTYALRANDSDLNGESGFPWLTKYLRERVVGQADILSRRSARHELLAVTEQLVTGAHAEQAALQDPDHIQQRLDELNEAQRRSAALKEQSARWNQTLSDGMADLNADIDYDLKDRMRQIIQEAEAEVEIGDDPTKGWDQFSTWVEQQVSQAVSATFVWTSQRARWLAGQVAEHFAEDGNAALPQLRTDMPAEPLARVEEMGFPEAEPFGISHRALAGLRGGYVGTLMVGMVTTVAAGMTLFNPWAIGAGVLLGARGVRDERRRVVSRRKNEAKTGVRRYCDDVTFQVGKDSKDMLRRVQRDLRDHFTAQAEEMNRSLRESVQAAENAMKTSKSDRDSRLRELKAELERVAELEKRIRGLLPEPEGTPPAGGGTSAGER